MMRVHDINEAFSSADIHDSDVCAWFLGDGLPVYIDCLHDGDWTGCQTPNNWEIIYLTAVD